MAGVDVSDYVGKIIVNAYKERCYKSGVLESLVKAKRLGTKNVYKNVCEFFTY